MSRVLWLVRHGERQDFCDPKWRDSAARPYDPPLSQRGRQQGEDLAKLLAGRHIGCCLSSPFLRALETATAIAAAGGIAVHVEAGVCEWLNPEWFQAAPEFPGSFQSACDGCEVVTENPLTLPALPESDDACRRRVADCIDRWLDKTQGDLLIVTHGIVVDHAMRHLTGHSPGDDPVAMASVTRLVQNEKGWAVDSLGDESHLRSRSETTRLE